LHQEIFPKGFGTKLTIKVQEGSKKTSNFRFALPGFVDSWMPPSIWKYLAPLTAFLQASLPKLSSNSPLASAWTMYNNNNDTPSKRCHVRVASYNVLSSHLASPSHFSTLNPQHLAANNRLPIVLQKLDQEIQQKAILCLQEVSYTWAGAFHTHFCDSGYYFVTGLYGKKFNGYMGVGIAFPQEKYKLMDVDIARYVLCIRCGDVLLHSIILMYLLFTDFDSRLECFLHGRPHEQIVGPSTRWVAKTP
jgi:hypothetical protein